MVWIRGAGWINCKPAEGRGMTRNRLKAWRTEFDRRVTEGSPVDKAMGKGLGRIGLHGGDTDRVQADDGRWHTREGNGCCGCGLHKDTDHPNYGAPPVFTRIDPLTHEHERDERCDEK